MKIIQILLLSLSFLVINNSWGYGTGVSTWPLNLQRKIVSAEFTGIVSQGGGVGVQARYTHKINQRVTFDGGLGFAGGGMTGRIFAGADLEIFPDYQTQPRVSIKATFEHAREFNNNNNIITFAPTFSKGFSFWGKEGFPFISIPVGISLDTGASRTYKTIVGANIGIAGKIPVRGMQHILASVEATIGVKNSYTGLFVGLSYPLQ